MIRLVMDRLERLLSLVHVLQSSPRQVSMSELRSRFPEYAQGSPEASRRKIERDKAELARIGLVVQYHDEDEEGEGGYTLNRSASYLPQVHLTPSQRRLLAAGARAAIRDPHFPHRDALRLALAKLDAEPSEPGSILLDHPTVDTASDQVVELFSKAIAGRKQVTFTYRKPQGEVSPRTLEPYGVFLKRGAWYVCGRDSAAEHIRVFRISRIESPTLNARRPSQPDYEIPTDFDLGRHTQIDPLHWKVHEPIEVRIRLDPEVAFLGARLWRCPPASDGTFTVHTTHLDYLVDQVLAFGQRAILLSPPEARSSIRRILTRVLEVHGVQP